MLFGFRNFIYFTIDAANIIYFLKQSLFLKIFYKYLHFFKNNKNTATFQIIQIQLKEQITNYSNRKDNSGI